MSASAFREFIMTDVFHMHINSFCDNTWHQLAFKIMPKNIKCDEFFQNIIFPPDLFFGGQVKWVAIRTWPRVHLGSVRWCRPRPFFCQKYTIFWFVTSYFMAHNFNKTISNGSNKVLYTILYVTDIDMPHKQDYKLFHVINANFSSQERISNTM
jgi:hypothetical protein